MKWICILFSITFWYSALAQNHCFTGAIKTDQVGTGRENIPFESEFAIGNDSIVLIDLLDQKYNLVFTISNSLCQWTSDFTKGRSEYEVIFKEKGKKANLTIIYNETSKVIELLYQDSKEKRVFRISELKGYVYR